MFEGGVLAGETDEGLTTDQSAVDIERKGEFLGAADGPALGTAGEGDFIDAVLASGDRDGEIRPTAAVVGDGAAIVAEIPGDGSGGEGSQRDGGERAGLQEIGDEGIGVVVVALVLVAERVAVGVR